VKFASDATRQLLNDLLARVADSDVHDALIAAIDEHEEAVKTETRQLVAESMIETVEDPEFGSVWLDGMEVSDEYRAGARKAAELFTEIDY